MESVILLGLMGVGYLMNKDKDDKHKIYSDVQPPLFNGSGNSVYDQANYLDAKKYEIGLINDSHDKSMEGDSKIIDSLNMSGGRNTLKDTISAIDDTIQSISGGNLSRDDFLVNDQGIKIEPFGLTCNLCTFILFIRTHFFDPPPAGRREGGVGQSSSP